MKRTLTAALLLAALYTKAQDGSLSSREFWAAKPNLTTVKAELTREKFNFKDVETGDDPLSLAINNDADIEVIKFLAAQPDVDFKRGIHEGRTYLHSAASKGNAEAVDVLLKSGSDMNYTDAHDQTALTYAAYMGKVTLPVIEAFVKNGFDVNYVFTKKNGANILLLAAASDKDLAITDYLVSKGVSLQSTDNDGYTVFDNAAKLGNIEILKGLLKKGAKYTNGALFMAAQGPFRSANKIDVFQYLVDEVKIDPTATNKAGQNVLHQIVTKQNQEDIIAYFFKKGVDINQADKDGNTPFMGAAGVKNEKLVASMLPKVKNINAVNSKGESALTNAVKSSNVAVVDLLLKNGADVKIVDKEGHNLAYVLVDAYRGAGGRGGFGGGGFGGNRGGSPAPQQQGQGGRGARGGFGGNGQNEGTQESPVEDLGAKLTALKNHGLDVAVPSTDGNTLYHLAVAKNDLNLVKKISSLGVDINAKNKEGMTALHRAAMLGRNDEILRYLLTVGADKSIETSFGETAYDLASENEQLKKENISADFLK